MRRRSRLQANIAWAYAHNENDPLNKNKAAIVA
jgi:hypothetical protein